MQAALLESEESKGRFDQAVYMCKFCCHSHFYYCDNTEEAFLIAYTTLWFCKPRTNPR
jgi:hypothetical protein